MKNLKNPTPTSKEQNKRMLIYNEKIKEESLDFISDALDQRYIWSLYSSSIRMGPTMNGTESTDHGEMDHQSMCPFQMHFSNFIEEPQYCN